MLSVVRYVGLSPELPDGDLLRLKRVGVFLSVLKLTFQTNILLY